MIVQILAEICLFAVIVICKKQNVLIFLLPMFLIYSCNVLEKRSVKNTIDQINREFAEDSGYSQEIIDSNVVNKLHDLKDSLEIESRELSRFFESESGWDIDISRNLAKVSIRNGRNNEGKILFYFVKREKIWHLRCMYSVYHEDFIGNCGL